MPPWAREWVEYKQKMAEDEQAGEESEDEQAAEDQGK